MSEKQISATLDISAHAHAPTLSRAFEVDSRAELLAAAGRAKPQRALLASEVADVCPLDRAPRRPAGREK